jgi:amino-acid N-acetyltransferase
MYSEGALMRSLAVAPEMQGRRVGHRLAEACIELARTADVPAVYLLTLTAEQFFARLGFEPIARADVPPTVLRSVEFAYACPPSSIAMRRFLRVV